MKNPYSAIKILSLRKKIKKKGVTSLEVSPLSSSSMVVELAPKHIRASENIS